jgi:hypothetical protein
VAHQLPDPYRRHRPFRRHRVPAPAGDLEIDGWQFHGNRAAFVSDRLRYTRLTAAGWTVLPFAAEVLSDDPEGFVALVRTALGA